MVPGSIPGSGNHFFCNITSPYKPEGNDMRHEKKTVSVSKIRPLWEPWEEEETPKKSFLLFSD